MNPFTTIPRAITVLLAAHNYNRNIPEIGQKKFIETIAPKINLTFEVTGEENIPETNGFMVYSNHQSLADIFALIYLFRDRCQMGYVAKEEWRKYKIIANAILYTRSVFLTRGDSREAIKTIKEATELLKQGFNLVIFPEGTRSKSHEMAEFKGGAFKFAEKGKVPILPVTLDGGYKLLEEKGTYQPAHVKITVHPLVHIEEMDKHQQKEAAAEIEATIRSALA